MNEVINALVQYLNQPWKPESADLLPVIRAHKEEAAAALGDYLRARTAPADADETVVYSISREEGGPLGEVAALVLLGEFGAVEHYDLMWDTLLKDGKDMDSNPMPLIFLPALMDALSEAYPGNAARAKAVLLDVDMSSPMRALGAEQYAYGIKNGMADRDEALDIFQDLLEDATQMNPSLAASLAGSAIYAGLDELLPMIEELYPKLQGNFGSLEEVKANPIPSPKFMENKPVAVENYQEIADLAYQYINEVLQSLDGQEADEEALPEWFDPEMEDLLMELDGLSQHEMTVYMQQHPDVAMKLQKYIRKAVPAKNMLANKKSSAPTESLDAFKSKKKKKGGKKPAKKAAKGKKK